jgi:hypothetical protein
VQIERGHHGRPKGVAMRIDEGPVGGLVVYGTAEEWTRFDAGLEDLYSELKHDVLPGAHSPTVGGVIVTLKEALAIMAIMEDEELTRSLMTLILADRSPKRQRGSDKASRTPEDDGA